MSPAKKPVGTLGFKRGTIGFEALVAVAWRVSLIIIILSLGIYVVVKNLLEDRVVTKIELAAEARAFQESQLFEHIEFAHHSAARELTALLDEQEKIGITFPPNDFDEIFYDHGDGSYRTRPELFDGILLSNGRYASGTGGILPAGILLDDAKKHFLENAFNVVLQAGSAHYPEFLSYYFFTANGELIIRAPDREDKLLFYRRDAPANFSLEGLEIARVISPELNPNGEFRCTSLQPIASAPATNGWTTGCHLPFYWKGKQYGAFGVSIQLMSLMTEAIANPPDGAENMIISSDGKLVAHPRLTVEGDGLEANIDIMSSPNEDIKAIFRDIQAHGGEDSWVSSLDLVDLYVAVGRIRGLDGFYVVAYPKSLIADEASAAALNILYAGVIALVVALLTLTRTVRRTVTEPLNHLRIRTKQLALGKFEDDDDADADAAGEIKALAVSTERMARDLAQIIGNLEDTVDERTRDLANARDVAQRASAAKTNFLANMSHEIRTPLTGIIGMLDLLSREPLPRSSKSYLDMARKSSSLLLNLVNDILDISRLEAGKFAVRPTTICISEAVEETAESLALLARQKHLRLNVKSSLSEPLWVMADLKIIRQILINLVGNAIKFTERGSITVRMDADMSSTPNGTDMTHLTLAVEDTGMGFSPQQLAKLYERFEQLEEHQTNASADKGTGLGLSIVKELVDLIGGTIDCESTRSQGTTFTVRLPLPTSHPSKQQLEDAVALANALDNENALEGIRILAVDDNEINRVIIEKVCEQLGADIKVLESGADMVARLSIADFADKIDVLLMDINMPIMDGLETLAAIRMLPGKAQTVPAIALTADAIDGTAERMKAGGMDGYVTKPIDPAMLIAAILALVSPASSSETARLADGSVGS